MTVKCKRYGKKAEALLSREGYEHGMDWNDAICGIQYRLRKAERRLQFKKARGEYFDAEYEGLLRNVKAGRHLLNIAFHSAVETLSAEVDPREIFAARTVLFNLFDERNIIARRD